MEHLSFENDALELLEACFLGLRPLGFVGQAQGGEVQHLPQSEESAAQVQLLQGRRMRQQEASSLHPAASPLWQEAAAFAPDSAERAELLSGQSARAKARPDAEAISRVIQRDARRYDLP